MRRNLISRLRLDKESLNIIEEYEGPSLAGTSFFAPNRESPRLSKSFLAMSPSSIDHGVSMIPNIRPLTGYLRGIRREGR